ncbi:MAG TPA: MarR family transcriptional regulator [Geobacterales bacterium]|nr:MarR family transcriptional regulator [Geobacterales bacterium]
MYEIEQSIGFLLAKVHQRGFSLFKEQLDPHNLTPPQFALLAFLWQEDNLSQAELSARTQIDRTTMGGLIDRLEKELLVERHHDPDDRRTHRIRLTQRGKSLEEELCHIAHQVTERFLAPITPAEQQTLQSLLVKLRY